MIFGRSTVMIMAAIAATLQFVKQVIPAATGADPVLVALIADNLSGVLAAWIAVIAYTSTTPIADPRLLVGTVVQATNDAGVVVGHVKVPEPEPAPVAPDVGEPEEDGKPD